MTISLDVRELPGEREIDWSLALPEHRVERGSRRLDVVRPDWWRTPRVITDRRIRS